jgi:hypothetical protein
VDFRLVSIKNGGIRPEERCKRVDCIFPRPTVRFDFDDGRILAAWSWVGVETVLIPTGIRISIQPRLLLVRLSCN